MMSDSDRDTGRTSEQMKRAAPGALFVWCTNDLSYPRMLTERVGRTDLKLKRSSALDFDAERLKGREFSEIVVDHAYEGCIPHKALRALS